MPDKEKKKQRWQKFKRFLKRNMTPQWAMHFSYQVFAAVVAWAMIIGVALYAFTKSYDSRELKFVDGFTITAHSGAFSTEDNSLEFIQAALDNKVDIAEIDVRQRPDGTVVMGHDIITTNNDGVEISVVFEKVKASKMMLNLDIKDIKALPELYKLICEYNLQKQVFMTGIESFQADAAARDCPGIEYYINYVPSRWKIFSDDYQQKLLAMLEKTGGAGINCKHSLASRTLSDFLHEHGYKLSVWTVDKKYQMKRALVNEPDNITTREVDLLKDTIKNWGKK